MWGLVGLTLRLLQVSLFGMLATSRVPDAVGLALISASHSTVALCHKALTAALALPKGSASMAADLLGKLHERVIG